MERYNCLMFSLHMSFHRMIYNDIHIYSKCILRMFSKYLRSPSNCIRMVLKSIWMRSKQECMLPECNGILSEHICIRSKYIRTLSKCIHMLSEHIPILLNKVWIVSIYICIFFYTGILFYICILFKILIPFYLRILFYICMLF